MSTEAFVDWLERRLDVVGLCEVLRVDFEPAAFRELLARSDRMVIWPRDGRDVGVVVDAPGSRMTPPPIHTDGAYLLKPPPVVVLACANAGAGTRPTVLFDSARAIAALDPGIREVLGMLEMHFMDLGWRAGPRPFLEPHPVSGELITNLVARGFVAPRHDAMLLLQESAVAVAAFYEELQRSEALVHDWQAGDLLVFDNYSYLHGPRVVGQDLERRLMQAWVAPRQGI